MTAVVWCVDASDKYNAMALHSVFSAREHDASSDFFVLTLKTNRYASLYQQIKQTALVYIDDEFEKYFKTCLTSINDTIASPFAYCRFLVFKLQMFKRYSRVLYLDCDTSIKKPFSSLFCIHPKDDIIKIMLVPERLPSNYNLKLLRSFCTKKNFQYSNTLYGNSGVMLVIPSRVANADFQNLVSLIEFKFPIHDQGILNFYFQNNIQFIDTKFNVFYETDPTNAVYANDIVIRQYAGKEKDSLLTSKSTKNSVLDNVLARLQMKNDKEAMY